MNTVRFIRNTMHKPQGAGASLADFGPEEIRRVRSFLQSFREYAPTPLHDLRATARALGVGRLFLKDESKRFGLNAFKVTGGAYAVGRLLAERLGVPMEQATRDMLCSPETRAALGVLTFVTATDGNHGRGIAWTAQQLGMKAKVYMPKGSAEVRAENIRATGAECVVTDLNYDDAVRLARREADACNGILVQDTAWDGYEDIPRWIMQGYTALAAEALEQMQAAGPTHLLLQAGVGSFAGAVLGFFAAQPGATPTTLIVEPNKADCLFRSFAAADGNPHNVGGALDTLMAGLACGEPSTISWPVLRDYAAAGLSCPDSIAANGMRILAAPLAGDAPIVSGESGAAPCGALDWIMRRPEGTETRAALGLGPDSRVLLISTEGDTSPDLYREIVHYGKHPDPTTA